MGFIATPRTFGRLPNQRFRPLFQQRHFRVPNFQPAQWSHNTIPKPIDARQKAVEGLQNCLLWPSLEFPRLPSGPVAHLFRAWSSTIVYIAAQGNIRQGKRVARSNLCIGARCDLIANIQPNRRQNIAFFPHRHNARARCVRTGWDRTQCRVQLRAPPILSR